MERIQTFYYKSNYHKLISDLYVVILLFQGFNIHEKNSKIYFKN